MVLAIYLKDRLCCEKDTVTRKNRRISLTCKDSFNTLAAQDGIGSKGQSKMECKLNPVKRTLVVALSLTLAGCSGMAAKQDSARDRQAAVEVRAQARWDALIKGELSVAYEYLSPGTRSMISPDDYRRRIRPGSWKKASIDKVSCGVDRCEVDILLEYSLRNIKGIKSQVKEIWLLDKGDWWYVPQK